MNYRAKILADTPLAYWRMDEASGNLADSSGNGKTATAAGAAATYGKASLVPNENDPAIVLTDSTNRFDAGDDSAFELQTFSVEAWFMATGVAASGLSLILNKMGVFNGWGLGVVLTGGLRYISFAGHGGLAHLGNIVHSYQISLNTPYHVVATTTPTTEKVYVNGALMVDAVRIQVATFGTESVIIGNFSDTAGFVGTIDEVAFYASELTAVQVANHYNVSDNWSTKPRLLLPQTPVERRSKLLLPARRTLIR